MEKEVKIKRVGGGEGGDPVLEGNTCKTDTVEI